MLIRRGKEEGWLHLDSEATKTWATANGVNFTNASPAPIPGRGTGLIASHHLASRTCDELWEIVSIPEDLVLSVDAIKKQALFDRDWRQVLEHLGEFGTTSRGAILPFLLFQASISCPDLSQRIGVHSPFADYVKSLPCEFLPTFWSPKELQLLVGTTLAPAISSKMSSLRREYDLLCEAVSTTRWYEIVRSRLTFDDWLQVDAMFRSRALDFYGSCMIPGIDLASHAAGRRANAFYDRSNQQYHLWLLEGKHLHEGEEINITYGDEKGACEMLFSYGFIEDEMHTAETIFLSLAIPNDDIARAAKAKIAACAPGFKIIDVPERTHAAHEASCGRSQDSEADSGEMPAGTIDWEGDFVWLLCVSADDGLRFELARTVDGEEELQATLNGLQIARGASDLRRHLAQSDMWPVYRLRAVVILQQRVFDQLQMLYSSQGDAEAVTRGDASNVRKAPYELAMKLRRLEFELLEKAYEDFERQKVELAETAVVQEYLAAMNSNN